MTSHHSWAIPNSWRAYDVAATINNKQTSHGNETYSVFGHVREVYLKTLVTETWYYGSAQDPRYS